ncbi:MAG: phenylpyruvate tautomerase MIF-related protein [Eubacteriales bacterium]
MPYINVKTTSKIDSTNAEDIASEITDSLSTILGKGIDTIMVDLNTADNLFMGGSRVESGAVVHIKVFGNTSSSTKKQVNTFLCEFLNSNLGIPESHIYVIFSDKAEWGYKGSFIS